MRRAGDSSSTGVVRHRKPNPLSVYLNEHGNGRSIGQDLGSQCRVLSIVIGDVEMSSGNRGVFQQMLAAAGRELAGAARRNLPRLFSTSAKTQASPPSPARRLAATMGLVVLLAVALHLFKLHTTPQNGSAEAQFNLGQTYELGLGVPKDDVEAALWYQKAADQDFGLAQFSLGMMYAHGRGVTQNYAQAIILLRRAADKGYPGAQNNLGNMYAHGRGAPPDYKQAIFWYQKSADQGDADAQYSLGLMYFLGQGVRSDYWQALGYFQKAAIQGYAPAQYDLGVMYANGQGVTRNASTAAYWYKRAAAQGFAQATSALEKLHLQP